MTTLPNDPPADADDWSHEQLAASEGPAADPDNSDVYAGPSHEPVPDADRSAFPAEGPVFDRNELGDQAHN